MTIKGKKYPVLWLFFLAWNAWDIPMEIHRNSWMWLAADVIAGAVCAFLVHKDWPREEPPRDLDLTKDVRDIWKDKGN